jgi:hypothetical protein
VRPLVGFVLGAVLFLGISPCRAQERDCVFYFTVLTWNPQFPDVFIPAMTTEQSKWYKKKGITKYPRACESYHKANYAFVWVRSSKRISVDVPKVRSAFTTSVIRSSSGNAIANSTTTWVEHERETHSEQVTSMFVFRTNDGKPIFDGGEVDSNYHYQDQFQGRHSSKEAFELLFDMVAKVEDVKAGHLK